MTVSRDVVRDLLPIYAAGEGTTDTRRLVEEWLARDPSLSAELAALREDLPAQVVAAPGPAAAERVVLERTRGRLRQRTAFLLGAVFCTTVSLVSYAHHSQGVHFMLDRWPALQYALLLVAAVCWAMFLVTMRRLRVSGL